MPIEISAERAICFRCGAAFGQRKGSFAVSYAQMYKGVGYLPLCKNCVDSMFQEYFRQCKDQKLAMRQMCRKLDLYWSENIYEMVQKKSSQRSLISQYLTKINSITFAGKSYDDTLQEEEMLWSFGKKERPPVRATASSDQYDLGEDGVSEDVIEYWGYGYSPETYAQLEQRRAYWTSNLPEGTQMDIMTEALLRQICSTEVDINKDRAQKRSVDKKVATLNKLLGMMQKQTEKKDDYDASIDNTPLGVWISRFENSRPLPQVDDDLKDTNHILKYVFTWLGHVCKMLGKKNGFSRLYEREVERLRVERPEFEDEDDEEMLMDVLEEYEPPDGDSE